MARNASETVKNLDDVCNVHALAKVTKTPVARVAETRSEEKLEMVFYCCDKPLIVESLSGFRICIVFADQYTRFLFLDSIKENQEAMAGLKHFVLSMVTLKKLRQLM